MKWNLESLQDRQRQIAQNVDLTNALPALAELKTVAGADISCNRFGSVGYAAIVVLSFPEMEILETAQAIETLEFPYIPGYLGFREWPLVRGCARQLSIIPDVLICDGQGIAHPRRAGLACHIGVETGWITVGCAKSRLVGDYADPGPRRGDVSDLWLEGIKIGEVVRSKDRVKPLFISPGHRIDCEHATQLTLALCRRYRLPEPIRQAHALVNRLRKENTVVGETESGSGDRAIS